MNPRHAILAAGAILLTLSTPARLAGQQQSAPHDHTQTAPTPPPQAAGKDADQPSHGAMHMQMEKMMAGQAKLDEFVKKMNAATGAAKTDAMAELLTALVNHHQGMCAAMMPMKGMMTEKGGSGAHDSHK